MRNALEVVREVGVDNFRVAAKQQRFHLDHRLLGIAPRTVGILLWWKEACSAFTRVAACTLAPSPIRDTLSEGFSYFVTSKAAPVASGWSVRRVGICTHWKAPPYHGAHPSETLAVHC